MLSSLVALLMLAAVTEVPPASDEETAQAQAIEPGEAADDTDAEAGEPNDAVAEQAGQGGADEPAADEEEDRVCRRRTEYDILGQPRSRRVCRAR